MECAAQPGHAARAAATSAEASPIGPDQISSPVAGLVDVRLFGTETRSTTCGCSSSCGCILVHRVAHCPHCSNLVVEGLPVVPLSDRGPDRLDLLDRHGTWSGARPIWVRLLAYPTLKLLCQGAKGLGRITVGSWIAAAAPIEENPVDFRFARCKRCDQGCRDFAIVSAFAHAKPPQHRIDQRILEPLAPAGQQVRKYGRVADQRQAARELREVPMDRLGLPSEGVEAVMVEISGRELRVPFGREPPWSVIEAFAGDVDVVAVEDAVDEPGGEVGC